MVVLSFASWTRSGPPLPYSLCIHERGFLTPAARRIALRELASAQPTQDGLVRYTEIPANRSFGTALRVRRHYQLVAFQTPLPALLLNNLLGRQLVVRCGYRRHSRWRRARRIYSENQLAASFLENSLNRRGQIQYEVKAVSSLHGGGCALGRAFGILATAVPRNNLHSRMPRQPKRETLSRSIRQ